MSGRCIDIGSGSCDVAVDFTLPKLKPNSTLVCSDAAEAMVNYKKGKYGDNERLSFIKLDIETRNLPQDLVGEFDHATSFYYLHWCIELPLALRNIYSLLRLGGTVLLTFVAYAPGSEAYTVLQDMPKYQAYMMGASRIIPPFQNVKEPRPALMNLLTGFKVRSCSYRAMLNYDFKTAGYLGGDKYDPRMGCAWKSTSIARRQNFISAFLLALSSFDTQCLPVNLRDGYLKDLTTEFLKRLIVFYKDHDNVKERCDNLQILCIRCSLRKAFGQ